MLFTRCPHCDTIFRVTDEALAKAGGRVRCGRCASVFDAKADLRETPGGAAIERAPPAAEDAASVAATARAEPEADAEAKAEAPAAATTAPAIASADAEAKPKAETPAAATAAPTAAPALAEPQAPAVENAARAATAERAAASTITPAEIDDVLTGDSAAAAGTDEAAPNLDALRTRRANTRWRTAVAVALVALGIQAVHYFRYDIVARPVVGPWLARTYAMVGAHLAPRWRVEQYRILDSAATASPSTDGTGTWKVRARFTNSGPLAQPYPLIDLELKNRWQETVASRRFTPDEYLARELPRERLMRPGETAQASLEVVDPGPDVSGFELDVCIEIETNEISCRNDEPFL